nr:MAG TPA: hypothetical protein [Caudoviricetes sp.]
MMHLIISQYVVRSYLSRPISAPGFDLKIRC